jgi:RimJ/RimL family protein N-acetyltransferase
MPTDARASAEGSVTLPVGADRQLVVRPVQPDDEAALTALYNGMDDNDRRLRFFCVYRPQPEWFADLAAADAHGGARVVAELRSPDGSELVGEAGYASLPNGNGELALLVARPWRGWLGPYLLDRLIDIAAARGVPNLEADVLTENRVMLALLRHRGAAVMDHDGWSTLRVRIGTAADVPTWDGTGVAGRVLVEAPGGRWAGEDEARAAGLSVLACFGPVSNQHCPALHGRRCPLAADADSVVVRYPPGDTAWEALIEAHRRLHPESAVLLEAIGGPPPSGAAGPSTTELVLRTDRRRRPRLG